tara:strand:+ start:14053 stop:14511 length:459 start_codon:yes stop_codon:yes gene_type:complete
MDYTEIITLSIFGFILFGIGLFTLDRDFRAKKYGKRTKGTVIDIEEEIAKDDDGDSTIYHLLIQFRDNRGNDVTKRLDFASSIRPNKAPPYKITIFYLKEGDDYLVVLAKNTVKMIFAYSILVIGLLLLIFVLLKATDQLEPLKNFILNLFS